jgi:hypothetical protein
MDRSFEGDLSTLQNPTCITFDASLDTTSWVEDGFAPQRVGYTGAPWYWVASDWSYLPSSRD